MCIRDRCWAALYPRAVWPKVPVARREIARTSTRRRLTHMPRCENTFGRRSSVQRVVRLPRRRVNEGERSEKTVKNPIRTAFYTFAIFHTQKKCTSSYGLGSRVSSKNNNFSRVLGRGGQAHRQSLLRSSRPPLRPAIRRKTSKIDTLAL